MPYKIKSKAQARFAHAAKRGDVPGVAPSVGRKLLHGPNKPYSKLPARKRSKR